MLVNRAIKASFLATWLPIFLDALLVTSFVAVTDRQLRPKLSVTAIIIIFLGYLYLSNQETPGDV